MGLDPWAFKLTLISEAGRPDPQSRDQELARNPVLLEVSLVSTKVHLRCAWYMLSET